MSEDYQTRYGPWALVIGGSKDVGAAAVEEAAARGLNVISVARSADRLQAQKTDLERRYAVSIRPLCVDLVASDSAERILEAVADVEIGLVLFIATFEPRGYFVDVPLAEHESSIYVNCGLPTILSHHLGRQMVKRGRGGIVLVSSLGALQGGKVFTTYFAAKAYMWILAEGLWAEFRESGVDVSSYIVGATRTANYYGQSDDARKGRLADDPAAARVNEPAEARDVGRRILDVVTEGPTAFVDEADAENARRVLILERREAVERMSQITANIRTRPLA